MTTIAKLFVQVGSNITGFKRGMDEVDRSIDRTSSKASFLSNALSTGLGILAAQGAAKLVGLGKSIIDTGKKFNALEENATIAFETMLGGTSQANQFMDELRVFAEKTPFELPGLITTAQKLKAFSFETQAILPMLTDIGDAVSGLGGSPELLNRITIALGQIKAKGRVQAQEMLQLTEAGIPAWEILAQEMGVTIPEAMKMSEKGALEANQAIQNLLKGMRGRFGGLMEKQSKTFTGLSSTLNDILRNLSSKLTKPWFDEAKKNLEGLINTLQSEGFQKFFNVLVKGSEMTAKAIFGIKRALIDIVKGGFSLANIFTGSSTNKPKKAILQMVDLLRMADKFLGNFANKRFEFLSNFNIKDVITSVTGFIDAMRGVGPDMNYWIGHMPTLLIPVAKAFKMMYEYIAGGGIQRTLTRITGIFKTLGSVVGKLVRPFKDAFGSLFSQLSSMRNIGFTDIFEGIIKALGKSLLGVVEVIKQEFWPSIKKGLLWLWDSIYGFFSTIDWGSLFNNLGEIISNISSYLQSVDWGKAFSSLWEGIKNIGSWLQEYILPGLASFFDWLLSWFIDDSKRQQLYNAISTTWNFISEWASKLVEFISPYLSSFWNWITSWFTDPQKRQTLWEKVTGIFSTLWEWAKGIWEFIKPYLESAWKSITSWITNTALPSFGHWREQFVNWSKDLWKDTEPELISWWGSFEKWLVGLNPKLEEPLANLRTGFLRFKDEFSLTWKALWTEDHSFDDFWVQVVDFGGWALNQLANLTRAIRKFAEGDWWAAMDSLGAIFNSMLEGLGNSFEIRQGSIIDKALQLAIGIKDVFASAFAGFQDYVLAPIMHAFNQLVRGINSVNSGFSAIGLPAPVLQEPFPGYALGGITPKTGIYKVNEKGGELMHLPGGTKISPAGTFRNSGQNINNNITINISGNTQIDRSMIDTLKRELQKELNRYGNRVAFT